VLTGLVDHFVAWLGTVENRSKAEVVATLLLLSHDELVAFWADIADYLETAR
jgi:hypothetical protein